MSLDHIFDRLLPQIESELQDVASIPHHSLGAYYGMLHYHLGWVDESLQPVQANPGKRLRPVILLLACEAAGGNIEQALPAAAAVELVHNFSLVHDDIQDVSHFRRGRRAVWDIWGMAHGINVGDGLFVLSRLALHRLLDRNVPFDRCQAAMLALDRACLALCEGQFFDMTFETLAEVDLEQYLWMIRHKTAALLSTSAQLGAIVAAGSALWNEQFYQFGENLGMAFQIQDDILGAWGDEAVTGKSAATDIRDKKKTLPVVYALNHDRDREAARRLAELYAQDGPLGPQQIAAALDIMEAVGAHVKAEEMAGMYYRRALQSLDQTGLQNGSIDDLRALAASLLDRQA
ncbi:MAG: polyprenyl synthetase family protein [Anaerolineae bacterium]|jgi:geranylgeranyl diphosphate synthase type I